MCYMGWGKGEGLCTRSVQRLLLCPAGCMWAKAEIMLPEWVCESRADVINTRSLS